MDKPNPKSSSKKRLALKCIGFFIILLAIPTCVHAALTYKLSWLERFPGLNHFLSAAADHKDAWLGFWASYLGAILGCIPAFLALAESRKQARQQHEEVQAQLEESRAQAAQARWEETESRRCSSMPILDLTIYPLKSYPSKEEFSKYWSFFRDSSDEHFFPNALTIPFSDFQQHKNCYQVFYVRNIGPGPVIDSSISSNGTLYFGGEFSANSELSLIFYVSPPDPPASEKIINFDIQYYDIFSNRYERTYTIKWTPHGTRGIRSTPPVLVQRASPVN